MDEATGPEAVYARRRRDVVRLLDWLTAEVRKHEEYARMEGVDFGHAGDLGHVRERLIETLAFLAQREEADIEGALAETEAGLQAVKDEHRAGEAACRPWTDYHYIGPCDRDGEGSVCFHVWADGVRTDRRVALAVGQGSQVPEGEVWVRNAVDGYMRVRPGGRVSLELSAVGHALVLKHEATEGEA